MSDIIVNRVEKSGLKTLNLESYFPKENMLYFDIKPYLFKELILKEKDFREDLKNTNWDQYENCIVLIHCSVDSILPIWSYILVASYLQDIAKEIFVGSKKEYLQMYYDRYIQNMNIEDYIDQRVIIHGCSDKPVPLSAFISITNRLQKEVKSLMFGEACSTVPIYKKKKD